MENETQSLSFIDSLKVLGIEDYAESIWKCSENGELFHIYQYFELAKRVNNKNQFREVFEFLLEGARECQVSPRYIFQNITSIISYIFSK